MGRTRIAKAVISDLKEKKEASQKKKDELIGYLKRLNQAHFNEKLSGAEYVETLHKKNDGRNIKEWVDYYENYSKDCEREIKRQNKELIKSKLPIFFFSILLISIFVYLSISTSFFHVNFTGLLIGEQKEQQFSQDINLILNKSTNYNWELENIGQLTSLRINGLIEGEGEGEVKIYLENLLILDSSIYSQTENSPSKITGQIIEENPIAGPLEATNNSYSEKEAPSKEESSPSQGELLTENTTQYNSSNQSYSEEQTQPGQPGSEAINESEALPKEESSPSQEEPQPSEQNITTTQNETINSIRKFTGICTETCDLTNLNLNKSSYTLKIEITNAKLNISTIDYTIIPKEIQNQALEEIPSETNITNITEIDASLIENATINTIQYQAVLGQPVKWKKQISLNESGSTIVELPKEAENIVVNKIIESYSEKEAPSKEESSPSQGELLTEKKGVKEKTNKDIETKDNKESARFSLTGQTISNLGQEKESSKGFLKNIFSRITGRATSIDKQEETIEVLIQDNATDYEIEYETSAPYAIEENNSNGKRVKIIGSEEVHYENVLSFTELNENLNIINPSQIKIYWVENNTYISPMKVEDKNGNGIYDYIEWIAPHLSNQTFDIIVIIKAEHLDSNRNFISDIYEQVRSLDNIWSETISANEYVRVTFETKLTKERDITIFPRIVSGDPIIEVYEKGENKLISEFANLKSNEYNKVLLNNLEGEQDTFDLKITGGNLQIDYIVDPPIIITFEEPNPTPLNNSAVSSVNQTIVANISNSLNTSSWIDFDRSLVGYWAMDYYNSTGMYDNSTYNNFGTFQGGVGTSNVATGIRGNALTFDGLDDYIDCGNGAGLNNINELTMTTWGKMTQDFASGTTPISKKQDEAATTGFMFEWYAYQGNVQIYWGDGATNNGGSINYAFNYEQWYSLAITIKSGNASLYVDGVYVGSVTGSANIANTNTNLMIGKEPTDRPFSGALDEVMIFNRSLSETEIKALYNSKSNKFNSSFTNLSQVQHNYTIYAIDENGNTNNSGLRNFLIDQNAAYSLNILYPTTSSPLSVSTGNNYSIYFNFSDSGTNITSNVSIDSVLIGGTNTTIVITPASSPSNNSYSATTINNKSTDTALTFPAAFNTGWDAGNASQACYTTVSASDNSNCTMKYVSGTNADLWMRMNFTIPEPINSIDSITITAIGGTNASTSSSENLSFQIANWSSSQWEFFATSANARAVKTTTYTGTTQNLSNLIRNGQLVLQFIGYNFDTTGAESFFIDYVNVKVNASNKTSQQVAYISNVGWQVNITAPAFANGLKDLFINTTYNGFTKNNTKTNAINYGSATDTTPPYFTTIPANASLFYGNQSLLVTFTATDDSGLGYYRINDTRFSINQTGFLSNASPIAVGNYEINVSINDTSNNINWTRYKVQINKSQENCQVLFNTTSPISFPRTFLVWANCTSAFVLSRNGTTITNNSVQSLSVGAYNFSMSRDDSSNYTIIFNQSQFIVNPYTDNVPPTYSQVSVNNTLNGTITKFSINVNDDLALDPAGEYIFSTNNTGSWVNDTIVNFIITPSWANVTKILNSTPGKIIGYKWYFEDNEGNTNSTPIYVLTTSGGLNCGDSLSTPGTTYYLNSNVTSPDTCFEINAENITLDCRGNWITYSTDGADLEYGIHSNAYINTTIKNCNILDGNLAATAGDRDGINIGSASSNSTLLNNYVHTGYSASISIIGSNNNITNNTGFSENDDSIVISGYLNNTLVNNNGTSLYYWGIVLENSNNNTLINNTGYGGDKGLVLFTSSFNLLINNTGIGTGGVTNGPDGIFFWDHSENNLLINNTGISDGLNLDSNSGSGIVLFTSSNNTFIGQKAIAPLQSGTGILILDTNNTLFRDCILINGTDNDIAIYYSATTSNVNNTMINCSYNNDKEMVDGTGSQLIRKWYYKTYVNQTNGSALLNTNVTARNTAGAIQFTAMTDSTGLIARQEIIDYINNGGIRNFYSNYSITANKSEYVNSSRLYNFTDQHNKINDYFTLGGGLVAPIIYNVTSISPVTLTEGPGKTFIVVNFSVYDFNGASNLNNASASVNFTKAGEELRYNSSCAVKAYSGNYANYTCNVTMSWWDASGTDWKVYANISDLNSYIAVNDTTTFTVNTLTGFVMSPSTLTFSSLVAGTYNQTLTDHFILNNTGNVDITSGNIEINATDLVGENDKSKIIFSGNFSASPYTGENIECNITASATQMVNKTFIKVANTLLSSGNYTLNDGTGQEHVYLCLRQTGIELTQQQYSTNQFGSWTIRIVLVAISVRRKKNKSSKNKTNISIPSTIFSKELGALESISKYMKENLGMSYHNIAELLNRDERTIWTAYNKATEKQTKSIEVEETNIFIPISVLNNRELTILESVINYLREKDMKYSEIAKLINRDQRNVRAIYTRIEKRLEKVISVEFKPSIPSTIFSKELGALESISKYMKENLGMSYHNIAELLNRDERTIWTAYNKATEKQTKSIEVEETNIFIPISVLNNRELTILESVINYLREKDMKYSEIAKLINRDQRNVRSIYNKTKNNI